MKTSPDAQHERIVPLDVLRGVAILLVLGAHAPLLPSQAGGLEPFAALWGRGGVSGVDLFFVLSGFLIGGLLFREIRTRGGLDVKRFLVRRAFRIWPLYLLWLVCAYVHLAAHSGAVPALLRFAPNLAHLQNYIGPWGTTPYEHTWSLAVEEHFYLALPLLLLLLLRHPEKQHGLGSVPLLAAGVALFCTGCRIYNGSLPPGTAETMFFREAATHVRMDALFLGVLLAYLTWMRPECLEWVTRAPYLWTSLGLLLLVPAFLEAAMQQSVLKTLRFNTTYLGYGLLLLVAVRSDAVKSAIGRLLASRAARAVAFVGVYSYPIYLWHVPFFVIPVRALALKGALMRLPLELRWTVVMLLFVALSVAGGYLLGTLLEKPTLALRDRLFPRREAVVT